MTEKEKMDEMIESLKNEKVVLKMEILKSIEEKMAMEKEIGVNKNKSSKIKF